MSVSIVKVMALPYASSGFILSRNAISETSTVGAVTKLSTVKILSSILENLIKPV